MNCAKHGLPVIDSAGRCKGCTSPWNETHQKQLTDLAKMPECHEDADAIRAALAEIERLRAALDLAVSALPDSFTAGPEGTGYNYAWDELNSDEQEWVKGIRQRIYVEERGEGGGVDA